MKNPIMTLQNFCIEVIVKEFEQFFFIFCNTDDVHMKRKFEFLQRVYSYDIAFKLNALDMMKPKYIDLLVNKYLKELNTCWLKDVPWETVAAKFAEIGSNIQKIILQRYSTEIPWQNIIHHLTNLEIMSFKRLCNDEILKCVAQFCHNIVEIDISDSISVTNEGIKYLCLKENGKSLCPQLKTLFFANCNVDIDGAKYLIKNLQSLEVTDNISRVTEALYSLHESDLLALDKVRPYNLTKLYLPCYIFYPTNSELSHLNSMNYNYYAYRLEMCLTLCPHLKLLYCSVNKEDNLNFMSGPSELEALYLKNSWHYEVDITNFVKLNGRKLTRLWLKGCTLSLPILSESCPSLKELKLRGVVSKDDGDIISVFPCLESCSFENKPRIYFDFKGPGTTVKTVCLVLEYSPKLEEIQFMGYDFFSTDLKNAVLQCCKKCPIRKVVFGRSKVDMNFVKDILRNCHTLEFFQIVGSNVKRIDKESLHEFVQVLPNCPSLYFR